MNRLLYALSAASISLSVTAMQQQSLLNQLPPELKLMIAQQLITTSVLVPVARKDVRSLAATNKGWHELMNVHESPLITTACTKFKLDRPIADYFFSIQPRTTTLSQRIALLSFDQKKQLMATAIDQSCQQGDAHDRYFLFKSIAPNYLVCILCTCSHLMLVKNLHDVPQHVCSIDGDISTNNREHQLSTPINAVHWIFGGYSKHSDHYIIRCSSHKKE